MPSGETSRKSAKLFSFIKMADLHEGVPIHFKNINVCSEEMCLKACADDIPSVHSPLWWHP